MCNNSYYITIIILISSWLGGYANFVRFVVKRDDKEEQRITPLSRNSLNAKRDECIVFSLVAAGCVPLFLALTQSNIALFKDGLKVQYMPFAGICLIASFFAERFIQKMSSSIFEKFKDLEEKVTSINSKIEVVREVLSDSYNEEPIDIQSPSQEIDTEDTPQRRVLKALTSAQYTFRTISGIARDASMEYNKTNGYLNVLKQLGLVNRSKRTEGFRWYITAKGREKVPGAQPPTNLLSEP